tara:strand:- start:568 stop:2181 length:1614 start_codon:yes stop_codon:yes gene_type:complete
MNNVIKFNEILKLAIEKHKKNNLIEAKDLYERALEINPNAAEVYNNLGMIYKELGDREKALSYIEKAIDINPNIEDAHNILGLIYKDTGEIEKAEAFFNKSIEINAKYVPAYLNLGNLFKSLGEIEKSKKYYQDAININPKYFEAYNNLMDLFERTNQNEKLKEIIVIAESQFKNNPIIKLFYGFYLYKIQKFNEAIENLEKIQFNEKQFNRERLRALILAKCYDKNNDTEKAFFYFKKTNEINYNFKNIDIDKNITLKVIEKRLNFFRNTEIKKWPIFKPEVLEKNPIFLIGFPRSGTTLLDTILRSHPSIEVIEEKPIVGNFVISLNKIINENFHNLKNIDEKKIYQMRKVYFENEQKYIGSRDNSKIYIDKMPLNIIHIGEIVRIFPNAKFILSLRHPCDCVISCFMQSFKLNHAMANFLDLKDTANLYDCLMNLWIQYKTNLTVNYLAVKYEDIVLNFDESVRKIFNFLEVPWSDNVYKFYKTAEKRNLISTPSYDQVNKPIYSSSIGKWKNYEKKMSNVIPILNPWIKKFNY